MRKLLPLLLALVGAIAGSAGGYLLRPPAETVAIDPCGEAVAEALSLAGLDPLDLPPSGEEAEHEYVKLNNQFVVPVVASDDVVALVILSISLEVTTGDGERVFALEPKLRDAFLQVLFDHANAGGFEGAFTQSNKMEVLRGALLEIARKTMGPTVRSVLIQDIVRQDA